MGRIWQTMSCCDSGRESAELDWEQLVHLYNCHLAKIHGRQEKNLEPRFSWMENSIRTSMSSLVHLWTSSCVWVSWPTSCWLFDGEHFWSKWMENFLRAIGAHRSRHTSRRRRNIVDFFHVCQADKTTEGATLSAVLKQLVLICWLSSWVCSSAGGKESVNWLMQRCCRLEVDLSANSMNMGEPDSILGGKLKYFSFFCTYPKISLHKVDSYINYKLNPLTVPDSKQRMFNPLTPDRALVNHRNR